LILTGISYLIYSIIFRNKVTFYFKNIKIIEGKEQKYFKLQLYSAVLNSLIIASTGIVLIIIKLDIPHYLLMPLLVHLINFVIKSISEEKGYIES